MCRLFGYRSNSPESVHQALITERNSLRKQSLEHKDGWGIAYYSEAPRPTVRHGLGAAHADPDFERVANELSAHAVVAHVRLASVGAVRLENAHPFVHDAWTFAHNGTVREFAKKAREVEALIDPDLRACVRGETDSERCFYVFLSKLLRQERVDINVIMRALVETLGAIARITDLPDSPRSSMNFMVCDGQRLVCTRRHRTLYYAARDLTGQPIRSPLASGTKVGACAIASEELWGGDVWLPIAEDHVVSIDRDMIFRLNAFEELGFQPSMASTHV